MTKFDWIRAITPRYTLFKFRNINMVAFDMFEGELYWQGLANYALWVLTGLLILLFLIYLWAMYIKAICVEPPPKDLRRKIKTIFKWLSYICIKLSFFGLISWLMGYSSWSKFNNQLIKFPILNTGCTLLEQLDLLPSTVQYLLKEGETANKGATELAEKLKKPELVEKIAEPFEMLTSNFSEGLRDPVKAATRPLREICAPRKEFTKIKVKKLFEVFLVGTLLCVWTILLGFLMLISFSFRSTLIMTIICILALITLILWGLMASFIIVAHLSVTDFCYNPIIPTTIYIKKSNPMVNSSFTLFYLTCKGRNPLKKDFEPLGETLKNMKEPIQSLLEIFKVPVLSRFGGYVKRMNEMVTQNLEVSTDIINSVCPSSVKDFQKLISLPCRSVFWALATLFVASTVITLLLTGFLLIAMKIRTYAFKFVPPKPPPPPGDICPDTCPGPDQPKDVGLYHFPPGIIQPAAMECPPSCKAFPKALRKLTLGLSKETEKRAELYACDVSCEKIYIDETGKPIPPECIVVSHRAVETENAYMCSESASKKLRDQMEKDEMKKGKKKKRLAFKSKVKKSYVTGAGDNTAQKSEPNKEGYAPAAGDGARKRTRQTRRISFKPKTSKKKDIPTTDAETKEETPAAQLEETRARKTGFRRTPTPKPPPPPATPAAEIDETGTRPQKPPETPATQLDETRARKTGFRRSSAPKPPPPPETPAAEIDETGTRPQKPPETPAAQLEETRAKKTSFRRTSAPKPPPPATPAAEKNETATRPQKPPCIPECGQDSKHIRSKFSLKKEDSSVRDANWGNDCRDCPCALKRRPRKSRKTRD